MNELDCRKIVASHYSDQAMTSPRAAFSLVGYFFCAAVALASGARELSSFAQRNEAFIPQAAVLPIVLSKVRADTLQGRLFTPAIRSAQAAPTAELLGPIEVAERQPKAVLTANVRHLEARLLPDVARFHRVSVISPRGQQENLRLVTVYQDSLKAASRAHLGREPVIDRSGVLSKLNRALIQKNRTLSSEIPIVSVSDGMAAQPRFQP